ncbi:glucose-6-phosphate dehydrogenase [Exilibacterium tricleocarpae]|uniref:Glucose-6-phosphate 1-dehydrogenase n=1 Tax=Exilibacterium tricleocarpae TaxID=2591008 RepID=A0A545U717_9GAMM|nr:glucose-6-phosphate dehydrogenase [Exilibacterium tricleocarpae]TQV85247.1 glucose-6-phosphate dehydrogenase [Exilibacterium tricleocarpae]
MTQEVDIVIFGGMGDLSLRKLLPALYRSELEHRFSDNSRIFLTCQGDADRGRRQRQVEQGLKTYLLSGEFNEDLWTRFAERLHYVDLDINDLQAGWTQFAERLDQHRACVRLFYLAIPPSLFGVACKHLAETQLVTPESRVVVEKPLGYDGASANAINTEIAAFFPESSIYRIDHYLGKETVQNLLALRFSNSLFEHLWDSKTIAHVQITIAETVGVEARAGFYDKAGALRDMVQNHLLQLLCLVAMEPPHKLDAENIRDEKLKVLKALRPITGDQVTAFTVRGQYVAAEGPAGEHLPSYVDELGQGSTTETFVAIRAHIDNWRWAGVPFYLRTGKRMKERFAEIVVQFKPVSHAVYDSPLANSLEPNRLNIRLQPEEGIKLTLMTNKFNAEREGLKPVALNLNFAETFNYKAGDAYKRLLIDAIDGNPSLFIHRREVDRAWQWADPIAEAWARGYSPLHIYRAGSWGPRAADDLPAADGNRWFQALEHDGLSAIADTG